MKKPMILLNSSPDREILRSKFLEAYSNWKNKNDYELKVIVEVGSIHILRQKAIKEQGLKRLIIIVDDDMLFTDETDFSKSIKKAEEKEVGMVTNGWKFSINTKREIKDEFINRKLVFTGGGMVLSINAQKVILNMPTLPYWSDNVSWSIECIKNGLRNYYYRGSMAIHKVCQNGGRKTLLENNKFIHHPSINVVKGVSGQILISSEKDIKWD